MTIEHGTQVIWQCPTSACICGCSDADLAAACTTEEVAVTNARVKLPRALGGFARRSGTVSLTDNQPYDQFPPSKTGPQPYTGENVSSQHFVDLDDPELVDVLIPLPEEETPYRPCFAFSANDARGDEAQVASLCLDDRFPADPIKEAPLTDGLANDQKKPSNTSSGCSASGPRPGPGSWLVALGLLAGLRGRRHLSRRERARASISGPVSLPSRVPSRLLSK